MKFSFHFFIALLLLSLQACVPDKPKPNDNPYQATAGRKVFMIHEGNYGSGNAALSVYNLSQDILYNDVYAQVNHESMGDVFQSMTAVEQYYFFAINHSDKILVCESSTMRKVNEISIPTPRNFLPIHERKLLVSSLYQKQISILNPQMQTKEKDIDLPYSSVEGMLAHDNKILLCPWDTNCQVVLVLDPLTDLIVDSIPLGAKSPSKILVDAYQNLWVLCGNIQQNAPYTWVKIDGNSYEVLKRFEYKSGLNEWIKPVINPAGTELYWIQVDYTAGASANNGICKMKVTDTAIPAEPWIKADPFHYFFALGIDAHSGKIFVGDPFSFIEQSRVNIYAQDGTKLQEMTTQMGIGDFWFTD